MESGRYPELARRFYENGPRRGEDALTSCLASQIKLKQLWDEDPRTMAYHLMGLLTGSPVRWFLLGFDTEPLNASARRKHIHGVVTLFLRAYGSAPEK